MNIRRTLQNKTEKEKKQFEISLKVNCIDFDVWPVNRRFFFVQEAEVLVKEHRRIIEFTHVCEKQRKTAM